MLRAGPFSDERVIRVINRRFVPVYFDLNPGGALADPQACKFVVECRPDLRGPAVDTPPLLLATPDGEVLAEIDNYASEAEVLDGLRAVLRDHPTWNQPGEEEKRVAREGTPAERANVLFDLGHEAPARRRLESSTDPAELLLLARFCRLAQEWEAMERALAKVEDPARLDEVRIERAWKQLATGENDAVVSAMAAIPPEHPRSAEARYLTGLAHWRARRDDEAMATWKSAITDCPQDPWIYRADWAFTFVKQGSERGEFSTLGERNSPLGRIGYMGRRPPDLEREPAAAVAPQK